MMPARLDLGDAQLVQVVDDVQVFGLDHLLRPRLAPGTVPPEAAKPKPAEPAKPKPARKGRQGAKGTDDPPREPLPPPTDGQLFARGFLFCLAFAAVRFVWGG